MKKMWSVLLLVGLLLGLVGPAAVFADPVEPQSTGAATVTAPTATITLGVPGSLEGGEVCWTTTITSGPPLSYGPAFPPSDFVRLYAYRVQVGGANTADITAAGIVAVDVEVFPEIPNVAGVTVSNMLPPEGCINFGWYTNSDGGWFNNQPFGLAHGDLVMFQARAFQAGIPLVGDPLLPPPMGIEAETRVDTQMPILVAAYYPYTGLGLTANGQICRNAEFSGFAADLGVPAILPGGAGPDAYQRPAIPGGPMQYTELRYLAQPAPAPVYPLMQVMDSGPGSFVTSWLPLPDPTTADRAWLDWGTIDALGNQWLFGFGAFDLLTIDNSPPQAIIDCPGFSDSAGHWSENYIEQLASWGVLIGFGDGTVRPDDGVTRAQFAKLVSVAMGDAATIIPDPGFWPWPAATFWDVQFTHPMAYYVYAAANPPVSGCPSIIGRPDGSFGPEELITRGEMAIMLSRAATCLLSPTLALNGYLGDSDNFTDTDGHAYEDFIRIARSFAFVGGLPDGSYAPDATTTRAEAAKMVFRLIGFLY